jgi:hypothetical protein
MDSSFPPVVAPPFKGEKDDLDHSLLVNIPWLITMLEPDAACTPDGIRLMCSMAITAAKQKRASDKFFIDMQEQLSQAITSVSYLEAIVHVQRALDESEFDKSAILDDLLVGMCKQVVRLKAYFVDRLKELSEIPPASTKLS